ncbi:MAG: ATP-binding cassette domain-containing protein [Candidatus Rokubacteria bacterium]|nr:ATP-binding cassette domain-containing protein [Candidatus Rokubacteria bacterium]
MSFAVRRGEVFGFLGPNGAEKSTTVRMLTGYVPPSDGPALLNGHDIVNDGLAARRRGRPGLHADTGRHGPGDRGSGHGPRPPRRRLLAEVTCESLVGASARGVGHSEKGRADPLLQAPGRDLRARLPPPSSSWPSPSIGLCRS